MFATDSPKPGRVSDPGSGQVFMREGGSDIHITHFALKSALLAGWVGRS